MYNYENEINEIKKYIIEEKKDIIIIGDNSVGKSDILKKIIEEKENYYYIDSHNRNFNYKNIGTIVIEKISCLDILKRRKQEDVYNLMDSFATSNIEQYYERYKTRLSDLINRFFGITLELTISNINNIGSKMELKINGVVFENLSTGYQAIIRIFLEVIYSTEENTSEVIIIDELNEFLSIKNEIEILPFLKREFPTQRFIITTHSIDVVSSAENSNIIVMKRDGYEILESIDYTTITDIRNIFSNLYSMEEKKIEKNNENLLRELYNLKLSNRWESKHDKKIEKIDEKKLTNIEKILLKNIKEWI